MTAHVYDPEQAGWRREPATAEQVRIDTLAAAGLFLLGVLSIVLTRAMGIFGDQGADPVVSVIMVAAVILPLALRRRFPSVVAVVVAAGFVVGGELRVEETLVINLALFCAIYTVGAWEADRRRAAWVRGGLIAVMAGWMVIAMFRIGTSEVGLPGEGVGALTPGVALMLWQIVINVLYFAGAYWFGEHAWNAARQRAIIAHHTRQLAAQQARVAAQAVTIERLRIARELHDAVAHHVSLMGVQAAAARAVIGRDVEAARAQLAGLEDSARLAVAELYELLGTLRDDDDPRPAPDPATAGLGLDGLPGLVAEAESAGLEVSLSTIGAPQPVPPLVGLNLYRIAQEALTNVVKHAGPGTRTRLRVRYLPGAMELEVADDGRGRPGPPRPNSGLGLPGMRERVASLRGVLTAHPRTNGGFLVRATVPLGAGPASSGPSDTSDPAGTQDAAVAAGTVTGEARP